MTPATRERFAVWLRTCFLEYQRRWILEQERFAICLKARQIGFTDATAGRCIIRGFGMRRNQIVFSAAEDNAKKLIEAAKRHCTFLSRIGIRAATDYVTDNTNCIAWRSGGSITADASSPRTARSSSGDTYFDEFAYNQDPEGLWKAAGPMGTRGDGQLRIISTPNGATGRFYEMCSDPLPRWSVHRVSLDDAERDGMVVNREDLLSLVGGDPRAFAEAYELAFLDANLQYLSSDLVKRARWTQPLPDLATARIVAGLDVGRHVDLTALTIVALVDEPVTMMVRGLTRFTVKTTAWIVAILTCKRTRFKEQMTLIDTARNAFGWEKLYVDKNGMGEKVAEDLVDKYGSSEVVPVAFTNESKAEMATSMFRWLSEDRLRIACDANDASELSKDMTALRRVVTSKGNIVYEIPASSRGHGDRFWSAAMPLCAALKPNVFRGLGQSPVAA